MFLWAHLIIPSLPHSMPENDEEDQKHIEEVFGFHPYLWQIQVVHAILTGDDVITIAPTGSGKSLTYWIPILYIKHGITVIVTLLKLLGGQFVDVLLSKGISAISITAANTTNELFEVTPCHRPPFSTIWSCLAHSVA
jgi:superfamily II DNA helicase RecQ